MTGLPKFFEQTSNLSYDRHTYKVYSKAGKTHTFDDYREVLGVWFQESDVLSHVEVQDKTKDLNRRKTMNQNAERINGWAAMLGVIAAIGAYASTGQIIPGIW